RGESFYRLKKYDHARAELGRVRPDDNSGELYARAAALRWGTKQSHPEDVFGKVVVVSVMPGSAAASLGLSRGHILMRIDDVVPVGVAGWIGAIRERSDAAVLHLADEQGDHLVRLPSEPRKLGIRLTAM